MQNLLNDLKNLLSKNENYCVEGKLLKNRIIESALRLDEDLISSLLKNKKIKEHFFKQIKDVWIFDYKKFLRFVSSKDFLPDSYTSFENKIGLTSNDDFVSKSGEVVLSWPYKDCVLEGGQTKEDSKRDEIFWNEILAPDKLTDYSNLKS